MEELVRAGWKRSDVEESVNAMSAQAGSPPAPAPPASEPSDSSRKIIIILAVILVVAVIGITIAASVIYVLGIFNPNTWTGSRAVGFTDLGAPDIGSWNLGSESSDDQFQVALKNYMPHTISVTEISVTIGNTECTTTGGTGTYDPGSSFTVTARCGPQTEGSSYSADVKLTYDNLGTDISGIVESGVLTGTVS
jgi:hypothetical protein